MYLSAGRFKPRTEGGRVRFGAAPAEEEESGGGRPSVLGTFARDWGPYLRFRRVMEGEGATDASAIVLAAKEAGVWVSTSPPQLRIPSVGIQVGEGDTTRPARGVWSSETLVPLHLVCVLVFCRVTGTRVAHTCPDPLQEVADDVAAWAAAPALVKEVRVGTSVAWLVAKQEAAAVEAALAALRPVAVAAGDRYPCHMQVAGVDWAFAAERATEVVAALRALEARFSRAGPWAAG